MWRSHIRFIIGVLSNYSLSLAERDTPNQNTLKTTFQFFARMNVISKSRYLEGLWCPLLFWCRFNDPSRIPELDRMSLFRMSVGHRIGDLAKGLFQGGVEVPHGSDSIRRTLELLERRVPLFEPAFSSDGLFCKVDLLVPAHEDEWDLFEVKSSTKVEEKHLLDVAFQLYVLKLCNVKVRSASVIVVNNEYVRRGELDVSGLLSSYDVTDEVLPLVSEVADNVAFLRDVLSGPEPKVSYGIDCREPDKCPVCSKVLEGFSIFRLHRFRSKAYELINEGIIDLDSIPGDVRLSDKQRIQVDCERSGKLHVDVPLLREFLGGVEYPLHLLDFESFNSAIPLFDDTRAYEHVPFQFSLHVVKSRGAEPEHFEFLAEPKGDPRAQLLDALRVVGPSGSVMAFNVGFERRMLEQLCDLFPESSSFLHGIIDRLVDLQVVFRDFVIYHPDQHGKTGMKAVLPALTGKSYGDLDVSRGDEAMVLFQEALESGRRLSEGERRALLEYCALDTQGMLDILRRLYDLAS
ncbi:DUF2779 domain-containing protein [Candidatus Woesearchaeota archaeon]|nr:MAG: DUF2779 domain-containing protein [Candidatus Woesearchaeota archaeon]